MTYPPDVMVERTDGETTGRIDSGRQTEPEDGGAMEAVGTYESGDDVVFYDSENPLAWVQSRLTLSLEEMA